VIAKYDLVISNLNGHFLSQLLQLAKKRASHVRWVALIEGDARDYLNPSEDLLRLFDAVDLIAAINEWSVPILAELTSTPVAWVGIPYPVDYVRNLAVAVDCREPVCLVCPAQLKLPSYVVAKATGLRIRTYAKKSSRNFRNLPLFFRHRRFSVDLFKQYWQVRLPDAEIRLEVSLEEFWRTEARSQIWVNLDDRYTWGRYVLDAAALGVPCITTRNTAHGPYLFPETCVEDVFSTEQAVSMASRLVSDAKFYQHVVDFAQSRLNRYSAEACVERLKSALGL